MSPRRDKYKALRVPCPKCGVYEGRPCESKEGQVRRAFHAERHTAAKFAIPSESTIKRKGQAKGYGNQWAMTRAKVFALKGSQCEYCGADASHVDHKTPKCRGGTDDIDNLTPSCVPCNISKGTMTVEEWRGGK
ncbi:MAG TPA: HNH endonuclease signature motif containing protein [Pseudorhodoplanes sp.]|nr:HNH endonuclease signature motif containing protein [Pseudorhodoplanes sp.]